MSITEELVKSWADWWYQDDGHVRLLSSEESAHILLDEICSIVEVDASNPVEMLAEVRRLKQKRRGINALVERDKARTMHDLRCPSCDVVVYDDWSDFCSYCGQRFKRSWSE